MSYMVIHQSANWPLSRDQLIAMLAECYRLTGADPDGNDDIHLAQHAVEEIQRLRQDSDEAQKLVHDLLQSLKEVVAISYRKHNAWDRARAVIARADGREFSEEDAARIIEEMNRKVR